MKIGTIDCETSIKNKGSAFTKDNILCQVGILIEENNFIYNIEYDDTPYGKQLAEIQNKINEMDILVFFNGKFDLHWLRRYGVSFHHRKVWDTQVCHFLITQQQSRFPALDEVAAFYGLGMKEDVVKAMWNEGIDTPDIPWGILESYLKQDLALTYKIYLKQKEYFDTHPELYRLFYLEMVDLLVLEEMEWNGMRFDKEQSIELANKTSNQLVAITSLFSFICPISFTSGNNISALLYGGIVKEKFREHYEVTLKSGEVKQKERWSIKEHEMPRLVAPLPKTEMAKKGFYATDKVTLQQLTHKRISKETKALIAAIIEYGDLSHLNGTYYEGLPAQMDLHGDEEYIHGQFNQVVAVTGRLSSSKPNLQNHDRRIDHCFISRF